MIGEGIFDNIEYVQIILYQHYIFQIIDEMYFSILPNIFYQNLQKYTLIYVKIQFAIRLKNLEGVILVNLSLQIHIVYYHFQMDVQKKWLKNEYFENQKNSSVLINYNDSIIDNKKFDNPDHGCLLQFSTWHQ
jgi:hypothetical protein